MKKILVVLVLAIVCGLGVKADGATPSKIIGLAGECDKTVDGCLPFPASLSVLCNGSGVILDCPQYFHPDWTTSGRFYGITNRVNPPRYVTSTDGGTGWGLITTQPFVAAVLNLGAYMAVASDGSLLAASGQGASTCIIRRSTDHGVSWSTVFTDAVQACSILFGFPTPPGMYCAESGGYCAIINMSSAATITVIYSIDNGANWTIGTAYAHVSADSRAWGPILTSDGVDGILIRGVNATGAGQPFGVRSGNDFTNTLNYVPAANQNCRPLFMGSAKRAVCAPNAGGSTYRLVTGGALATAPVEINTFTVADTSGALEPQVVGFNDSTGYMIQVSVADPTRLNMFITRDAWVSVVLAGQVTPTTVPVAGCCKGNIMKVGGKIYFSSGSGGSTAFLMVIQ